MLPGAMANHLFLRKSFETLHAELEGAERLHRVLGPWGLTAMGIGAIIGAGIFVLTGLAAHDYAGPSLMLSFLLAGAGLSSMQATHGNLRGLSLDLLAPQPVFAGSPRK